MPTAPAMPAFGWRVDDSQAAAVLTYIRNSWDNLAPPVAASTIAKAARVVSRRAVTLWMP
jgi:mono/diheme cytochrome c family protein